MPRSRFRIKSVAIEGFKAFTKRQSFELGARHVFLFGENGLGKTSFVEAIRWCLFGLASRPGGIIKNQFHGGPCVVELTLQAPDGNWSFQRRLRPSSGIGDLTIRDPSGSARNLEDVFPQLSRIGPRQGTHVIYAAQQPSSRRPEADITDFSYVVFRYLGIEDVPRLTDLLLELSGNWKEQEASLLSKVDELGEKLSDQITEVTKDVDQITSDPPWGATVTPTFASTRNKIDALAREAVAIGADCSADTLDGLGPGQKLTHILAAVQAVLSEDIQKLQTKFDDTSSLLASAESLHAESQSAAEALQAKSDEVDAVTGELACVLAGATKGELATRLEKLDVDLSKAQANLDVVSASLKYVMTVAPGVPQNACPACRVEIDMDEFKLRLEECESSWDADTKDLMAQRTELQNRISAASELIESEKTLRTAIAGIDSDLDGYLAQASKVLRLSSSATLEEVTQFIEEHKSTKDKLQAALESQRSAEQMWQGQTEKLRQELRFHRLRSRNQELQSLHDTRYEALKTDVKELTLLRDIVGSLRNEIKAQLDTRLQSELPPVAEEMTEVYLRLTERPTFDAIIIHQREKSDGRVALDLRVSSTRGSGTWSVEEEILNGQALNAIQLVPYFVFSRYQEGPLLDLLLLDDPTQAFDTRKIELLLEELSDAASHATLLVSTHEEDRFLPVLNQYFAEGEVKALRAIGLDEDGPHLENIAITA